MKNLLIYNNKGFVMHKIVHIDDNKQQYTAEDNNSRLAKGIWK